MNSVSGPCVCVYQYLNLSQFDLFCAAARWCDDFNSRSIGRRSSAVQWTRICMTRWQPTQHFIRECVPVHPTVFMLLSLLAAIESNRNLKIGVSLASFIHQFAKSNYLHIKYTHMRTRERTRTRASTSIYLHRFTKSDKVSKQRECESSSRRPQNENDNRHK